MMLTRSNPPGCFCPITARVILSAEWVVWPDMLAL